MLLPEEDLSGGTSGDVMACRDAIKSEINAALAELAGATDDVIALGTSGGRTVTRRLSTEISLNQLASEWSRAQSDDTQKSL